MVKNATGIKVYVRSEANSSFDSFKAEMTVSASMERMIYILQNLHLHRNIFPDTEELKILERNENQSLIQYSRTSAPWPVDDRDGVYEMKFKYSLDKKEFRADAHALPDYLPEKEGAVRIKSSKSLWIVEEIGNGQLKITYEVSADPGGSIPSWLANTAATEIPYQTFVNLRKELQR